MEGTATIVGAVPTLGGPDADRSERSERRRRVLPPARLVPSCRGGQARFKTVESVKWKVERP